MDSQFNDWNRFCKSEYDIIVADLLDSDEETVVGRILNSLNSAMKKNNHIHCFPERITCFLNLALVINFEKFY